MMRTQENPPSKERKDWGPETMLERHLIEDYLAAKGFSLADLANLPEILSENLMREACRYASLKLAEIEAKGHFRERIRYQTR